MTTRRPPSLTERIARHRRTRRNPPVRGASWFREQMEKAMKAEAVKAPTGRDCLPPGDRD